MLFYTRGVMPTDSAVSTVQFEGDDSEPLVWKLEWCGLAVGSKRLRQGCPNVSNFSKLEE